MSVSAAGALEGGRRTRRPSRGSAVAPLLFPSVVPPNPPLPLRTAGAYRQPTSRAPAAAPQTAPPASCPYRRSDSIQAPPPPPPSPPSPRTASADAAVSRCTIIPRSSSPSSPTSSITDTTCAAAEAPAAQPCSRRTQPPSSRAGPRRQSCLRSTWGCGWRPARCSPPPGACLTSRRRDRRPYSNSSATVCRPRRRRPERRRRLCTAAAGSHSIRLRLRSVPRIPTTL